MNHDFNSIESHVKTRTNLRKLLAEHRFEELDKTFEQAEDIWLDGPPEIFSYRWYFDAIFDPLTPQAEARAHMLAWAQARPGSYHAHLLCGIAWDKVAAGIRSTAWGSEVSQAQWIGAQLAHDHAVIAWLRAMALRARPAYAYRQMMGGVAYLGEPEWLLELWKGPTNFTYARMREDTSVEAWDEGVRLLREAGGDLATIPAVSPVVLPERPAHEWTDGKTYWLRTALAAKPKDVGVLEDYLGYLYPRWGGSHEQMQAFIDGPLCVELSEQERNSMRYLKAEDELSYFFPDHDDEEGIRQRHAIYDQLLALDFGKQFSTRSEVLSNYALWLCKLADKGTGNADTWDLPMAQKAYDLLAHAWSASAETWYFGVAWMQALQLCTLWAKIPDERHLMRESLLRAERWGDEGQSLQLLAVARKFGLFGFTVDDQSVTSLLERSFKLGGFAWERLAGDLFGKVSREAGLFLLTERAERGDTYCMAVLSDVYSGGLERSYGIPVISVDTTLARHWTERAAAGGHAISQFNVALQIRDDHPEGLSAELNMKFRTLLQSAWETGEHLGALREITRHLAIGSEEDRRLNVDYWLPLLWRHSDEFNQQWAAFYYARACYYGDGGMGNRYLAKIWIDRAIERAPDDESNLWLAGNIYRKGELLGRARAKVEFFLDKRRIDERMRALSLDHDEMDS